ncbi:MAG: hypothetical protein AB8B48_14525 [Pseudomonadales bacterium]
MRTKTQLQAAVLGATLCTGLGMSSTAFAGSCNYKLENSSSQSGTARVIVKPNGRFKVKFKNARAYTLYTVWIDHKNRASDQLAADYPLDQGALERGVAPAFASTTGVTSGVGLDANAVITNANGNATLNVKLDYDLLAEGDSPVVSGELTMQGMNRVGGAWLREYPQPVDVMPSVQTPSVADITVASLPRSTPQGVTVVRHDDFISHGHTPGVGNVDHFSAFKGDFPASCLP